ncbi:MAG TPA: nucleotidyl transferase AbiEii/AbiGii toxin family protein [Verrucomicrobiales bacterium]|nr:nucleotidyl transferase AbiEii/AbiGii toxin family protein [Verrucomicrobiales bacterium]HIL71500.1 nucleotidyl transferase AbiEii/AbiGii toxin family protein [Verrucomicrobiota bacterium]
MKNVAASIKDRLQNVSRSQGCPLNRLLDDFALARLFARVSESTYRDKFVLKGAQLFTLWAGVTHRPTRDADFLSFGSPDPRALESIFDEICALTTSPPDGLKWLPAKAASTQEENIYGGVRIKIFALLGTVRIPVQIDIGFGDSITPKAQTAKWKMPLDFPPMPLLVYCPETVIAEKLQAVVILGTGNSRMKDFFDLLWLSRHRKFDGRLLQDAVQATFIRRETPLPNNSPVALTEIFYSRSDKQAQWTAFLRKSVQKSLDLKEVVEQIARFLNPVIRSEVSNQTWNPKSGWIDKPS